MTTKQHAWAEGNSRLPTTAEMIEMGLTRSDLPAYAKKHLTPENYQRFIEGWVDATR